MFEWITDPQIWIAFVTLSALEIVLGIDNIIFISILANRLPVEQRAKARNLGLGLALLSRLALLFSIVWIMGLTEPLFTVLGNEISGRDIILIVGGLFLIGKAVFELHHKLEGHEVTTGPKKAVATMGGVLVQILLIDIVFSLDSVITAVGMVDVIGVMVAAMILAVTVMLLSAGPLSRFIERHPTITVLALSFLIVIGVNLVAEGLGQHIPKGYTYFAMAFAVAVEMLNLKVRGQPAPVHLHGPAGGEKATL
jgi:predicted tellurium resistance membrane protein TerC